MRNVKDVLVSWFYHTKLFEEDELKLDKFFELFITDNHTYSPYWKNILGFWNKRHLPNILFLQYEEMIRDLPSVINRTASFLETSVSPWEMEKLLRHLSFAEMKKNNAVNMESVIELLKKDLTDKTGFIRKGKVGAYREELTEEMIQLLDVWTEVNTQNTGFKYNAIPPPELKNYAGTVLSKQFDDYKERIENFSVRTDDIWVASFPRSGENVFMTKYHNFCYSFQLT
ncbi:hypothetical protein AMK59_1086 [Oryctes borbonicus]|uniref:Sulfotransferase domain-containing protein n=1 Tax=Oryctes borbonicus TaxID=1629725 RepID=A0A0T6BH10_9SCAR|nr:hypothetical protein AMK59_1086 [Oryctes borbonicus]